LKRRGLIANTAEDQDRENEAAIDVDRMGVVIRRLDSLSIVLSEGWLVTNIKHHSTLRWIPNNTRPWPAGLLDRDCPSPTNARRHNADLGKAYAWGAA